MTILLLGDSHLDRVRRHDHTHLETLVGVPVENRAVGGSTVRALPGQAAGLDLASYQAVVVSLGTNDAAPWGQVALADFRDGLAAVVGRAASARWVAVTTPGVDDPRVPDGGRSNDVMSGYADTLAAVVESTGGVTVRSRDVIAPLGSDAFVEDGFHLSPAAYELLLPAIAAAVDALQP